MLDFDFACPTSLADAIEVLAAHNGSARPLAGGTDLIDYLRTGRLSAKMVVDLKRIPELRVLTCDANGLTLGAAVPCCEIYGNEQIVKNYSALSDACSIIGGLQIQSRASVGGNLCTSGPAADSTPALIALNAQVQIIGKGGSRSVSVEDFCTGPSANVLQPGEIVQQLTMPAPAAGSGSHYRRFIPRNEMDIAVVGVGASVTVADGRITAARVGLGAVAPKPLFAADLSQWLVGQSASDATYKEAGERARQIISPIDDHRGTAEFRTHVTGVLVERVLREAVARATT
ncbi:MAG: xanthine dehydrogenase family protein subunit M [Planctomycetaceae bacterium]|nr:xanthine dehydrogenase family protein subunit M [Planctomycetaceae bacterium]